MPYQQTEVLNLTGAHTFKIKFYGVQPFTVVSYQASSQVY